MSASLHRLHRHRERKRAGKAVLHVEVQIHDLADALTESGFLKAWDSENPAAITAATEAMLAALIRVSESRGGS